MFYYSCRNSLVFLLPITAHIHNLQNVVVGAELQSTNVDLYIFLQEIFGQLTNLLWPSGTPHQSLAVWLRGKIKRVAPSYCKIFPISNTQNSTELKTYSNLINNFPDLWFKTHVQHSVCFIQNEVRASAEVCLSWFQKVNEPPWSGNADLHTLKRKLCENSKMFSLTVLKNYWVLSNLFPGHGFGALWEHHHRCRWTWGEKLCHIPEPLAAPVAPAHELVQAPDTSNKRNHAFKYRFKNKLTQLGSVKILTMGPSPRSRNAWWLMCTIAGNRYCKSIKQVNTFVG